MATGASGVGTTEHTSHRIMGLRVGSKTSQYCVIERSEEQSKDEIMVHTDTCGGAPRSDVLSYTACMCGKSFGGGTTTWYAIMCDVSDSATHEISLSSSHICKSS